MNFIYVQVQHKTIYLINAQHNSEKFDYLLEAHIFAQRDQNTTDYSLNPILLKTEKKRKASNEIVARFPSHLREFRL